MAGGPLWWNWTGLTPSFFNTLLTFRCSYRPRFFYSSSIEYCIPNLPSSVTPPSLPPSSSTAIWRGTYLFQAYSHLWTCLIARNTFQILVINHYLAHLNCEFLPFSSQVLLYYLILYSDFFTLHLLLYHRIELWIKFYTPIHWQFNQIGMPSIHK
jgi:hypothetical protein